MNEVLFNPPPTFNMQAAIHASVSSYFDDIDNRQKHGGIFTVATRDEKGNLLINAVVVYKIDNKLEVAGYIGKRWGGELVGGVEAKYYF